MTSPDLLIVGAGPVGCVIAERCASQLGWQVLIIDKRDHIAGNTYDCPHDNGVLIHRYGPHYFRTNRQDLLDYLSQFTDWIPGNYIVKSMARDGQLFPFPINLDTLEQFFNRQFANADEAQTFLNGLKKPNSQPQNSEEAVLDKVGEELYEAFYHGYTKKQWDKEPRDLDASVCNRIPVRLNRDPRYVDHTHQVMPAQGYTALYQNMIDHPKITVQLSTAYESVKNAIKPTKATVYCGPIDAYFDYYDGPLEWRSLDFEFKIFDQEFVQPVPQISYPNDFDYTRTFESKHVTGQQHPQTVVCYEYPQNEGDPYYPVPSQSNRERYARYKTLADKEWEQQHVMFVGRLAQYTYINMDEAIERALAAFETLKSRYSVAMTEVT